MKAPRKGKRKKYLIPQFEALLGFSSSGRFWTCSPHHFALGTGDSTDAGFLAAASTKRSKTVPVDSNTPHDPMKMVSVLCCS